MFSSGKNLNKNRKTGLLLGNYCQSEPNVTHHMEIFVFGIWATEMHGIFFFFGVSVFLFPFRTFNQPVCLSVCAPPFQLNETIQQYEQKIKRESKERTKKREFV